MSEIFAIGTVLSKMLAFCVMHGIEAIAITCLLAGIVVPRRCPNMVSLRWQRPAIAFCLAAAPVHPEG